MKRDIRSNFFQMFKELSKGSKYDLETFLMKSGTKDEVLQEISRNNNLIIDESILNFYNRIGNLKMYWLSTDNYSVNPFDKQILQGECRILSLNEMLGLHGKVNFWNERFTLNDIDYLGENLENRFCPFDFFNSDDSECVGFIKKGNYITDELVLITQNVINRIAIKLNVSINQYLKDLIFFKGVVGWQNFYFMNEKEKKKLLKFFESS